MNSNFSPNNTNNTNTTNTTNIDHKDIHHFNRLIHKNFRCNPNYSIKINNHNFSIYDYILHQRTWTETEDNQLLARVDNHRELYFTWSDISKYFDKNSYQCFLRYNYLIRNRNKINKVWTISENKKLLELIIEKNKSWKYLSKLFYMSIKELKRHYRYLIQRKSTIKEKKQIKYENKIKVNINKNINLSKTNKIKSSIKEGINI